MKNLPARFTLQPRSWAYPLTTARLYRNTEEMERLSRFRRHKKESHLAAGDGNAADNTAPPNQAHPAEPEKPQRHQKKSSPFRALHLRSSTKRARSSPPASFPDSHTVTAHDGLPDRPPISAQDEKEQQPPAKAFKPKIPVFLTLSLQDVENKFQELIWRERERIKEGAKNPTADHRWARVTLPAIRAFDRYQNVQPWLNNRVRLRVPPGQIDYINASPVVLDPPSAARAPDRYIAMQGPKQNSVGHVWRMIVEQLKSPGVVVMLTETHEGQYEKCFQYFPRIPGEPPMEINEMDEFGDGFRASVICECLEDTPAGSAIELRKLVVRVHRMGHRQGRRSNGRSNGESEDVIMQSPNKGGADVDVEMKSPSKDTNNHYTRFERSRVDYSSQGIAPASSTGISPEIEVLEERVVWHFLYKRWPDFGVPALEDLDSFFQLMELSRAKNAAPDNPRIVHCSAGIGRTGTFIALEHLTRELDAGYLADYDSLPHSDLHTKIRAGISTVGGALVGKLGASNGAARPGSSNTRSSSSSDDSDGGAPLGGSDLIFQTVDQLRMQRRTMVQAEAQYVFIYQVMRKLWQDKYGTGDEDEHEPAAKRLGVDPFVEN